MYELQKEKLLSQTHAKDALRQQAQAEQQRHTREQALQHQVNLKQAKLKAQMDQLDSQLEMEKKAYNAEIEKQQKVLESQVAGFKKEIEIKKKQLEKKQIELELEDKNIPSLKQKSRYKSANKDVNINPRRERIWAWFKMLTLYSFIFVFIILLFLIIYLSYRWAVETPSIRTAETKIEKIVEKEIIPDECTQIRRNGKVYISCDGVQIDGTSTISESGIKNIPDLVTE